MRIKNSLKVLIGTLVVIGFLAEVSAHGVVNITNNSANTITVNKESGDSKFNALSGGYTIAPKTTASFQIQEYESIYNNWNANFTITQPKPGSKVGPVNYCNYTFYYNANIFRPPVGNHLNYNYGEKCNATATRSVNTANIVFNQPLS